MSRRRGYIFLLWQKQHESAIIFDRKREGSYEAKYRNPPPNRSAQHREQYARGRVSRVERNEDCLQGNSKERAQFDRTGEPSCQPGFEESEMSDYFTSFDDILENKLGITDPIVLKQLEEEIVPFRTAEIYSSFHVETLISSV